MPVTIRHAVFDRCIVINKSNGGGGPVSRRIIYEGDGSPEGKKSLSRNARLQRAQPSLSKPMGVFKAPFLKVHLEFSGRTAEVLTNRSGETLFR